MEAVLQHTPSVLALLFGILIGSLLPNFKSVLSNSDKKHKNAIKSPVNKKKETKEQRRKQKKVSTQWITCDIIVAKEEVTYRKAVVKNVKATDTVLEVGCHVGVTTALISKYAEKSIGIDSSEFSIKEAKKRKIWFRK